VGPAIYQPLLKTDRSISAHLNNLNYVRRIFVVTTGDRPDSLGVTTSH
jgi:hypothetical protein